MVDKLKNLKKIKLVAATFLVALSAIIYLESHNAQKEFVPNQPSDYNIVAPGGYQLPTSGPRIPVGWHLLPYGTQINTLGQPSGASLSPDGNYVYVPTTGQWDESVSVINTNTLSSSSYADASAFVGAAQYGSDANGIVFVSAGGRNLIYEYPISSPGSLIIPPNSTSIIPPLAKPQGIATPGYPATLDMAPNSYLLAAGDMPLSQSQINSFDSSAGNCPTGSDVLGGAGGSAPISSCSAIDVINVSNPSNLNPPTHLIPVGQDAYDMALNSQSTRIYVSNWADGADTERANGDGTVSVINYNASSGTGQEIQSVPVGLEPMGIALSPDGKTLAVSNSRSDSISLISLDASGNATSVRTVPVGLSSLGIRGSQPVSVAYSPDGRYLVVTLFGYNALEILNADGTPIPETVNATVSNAGTTQSVNVSSPGTFIPVGWDPLKTVIVPSSNSSNLKLFTVNFQGNGTGNGLYNVASDYVGANSTEGSVSAMTVNLNSPTLLSDLTDQTIQADDLFPILYKQLNSPVTNPCTAVNQGGLGTPAQYYSSDLLCSVSEGKIPSSALHVVVLYRENKTVDTMLGYLKPNLPGLITNQTDNIYGPDVTANLAKLAMTYGMNDNNWVGGDESETGHNIFTGGETTPPTEIFVHIDNDFGLRGNRNGDPLFQIDNPRTRLADEMLEAGYSERTYGGDLNNNSPANANDIPEALWGNQSSPIFSGTNTDYLDTQRAGIFTSGSATDLSWDELNNQPPPPDYGKTVGLCGSNSPANFCNYPGASPTDFSKYSLAGWEQQYSGCIKNGGTELSCQSAMPNLSILEMPDDHTDIFNGGNNPRTWAPQVMVANNDYATGEIVQALSNSPFYKYTLVMIMEDDTQLSADNINVLRSYVVTAGGLARTLGPSGEVSHQTSSFCAVDKLIEDLFKLPSMSICDASSAPLTSILAQSLPSSAPSAYQAAEPSIPYLLPYPQSSNAVEWNVWCSSDAPTGIGFEGIMHFQNYLCFDSYVGGIASTLNLNG